MIQILRFLKIKTSVGHETFREKKMVSRKQFRHNKKIKFSRKKFVLAHILAKVKSFRENTRQKIHFREPFLFSRKRYLPTLVIIIIISLFIGSNC